MASLFNTKISNTYVGLIKTIDNAVISASLRELTDGSGNQTGVFLNNAGDFKVTNILEFGSLKDTGESITITKFVDEADGIANNDNDTSIPTSAAVKDFVTSQITLEDLDFSGDSGTGSVDLDSQVFAIVGTANEIETSAGSQQLQIGIPSNPVFTGVVTADGLDLGDDEKIRLGSGQDFEIYNDSSGNIIDSKVADLIIQNTHDNKDIIFKSDDGSGGTATYFKLDGSASVTEFSLDVRVVDNKGVLFGSGGDSFIKHTGSNMILLNDTGDITFTNRADDKDIIFQSDNGSGGVENYIQIDGSEGRTTFNKTIRLNDNVQLQVGSSADLQIFHTGSLSHIRNNTGNLEIRNQTTGSSNIVFKTTTSNGLETLFSMIGADSEVLFEKTTHHNDNVQARFGNAGDLRIFHNGSNSAIQDLGTGNLLIAGTQVDIMNPDFSEYKARFLTDGAVELYHNNSKKFETTAGGVSITGTTDSTGTITVTGASSNIRVGTDTGKFLAGASNDLQIYHDGTNSYIQDAGTGSLIIEGTTSTQIKGSSFVILRSLAGENMLVCNADDSVDIYYDGSKKFETTSTGVSVTGNIVGSGNLTLDNTGDGASSAIILGGDDLGNKTNSILFSENRSSGSMTFGFTLTNEGNTSNNFIIKNHNNASTGNNALTIARDDGAITTGGNLTVAGDLTVNGTTTTVNTDTLAVEDPLISMAKDNSANSVDIGFYGRYNDGTNRYLGLFADASNSNNFKLFKGLETEPTTTVDITATGYSAASLTLDNLETLGFVDANSTISYGNSIGVLTFGSDRAILRSASGKLLELQTDGGSTTLTLDNSQNSNFAGNVSLPDSKTLNIGTGNDLKILHDGTNSVISNETGDLQIINNENDKDIVFFSDNGSGGIAEYLRLDGSDARTIASREIRTVDGVAFKAGNSGDLSIFHDGGDSSIDNLTGDLNIKNQQNSGDIIFRCDNGNGGLIDYFRLDGSEVITSFNKDIKLSDNVKAKFGSSSDLEIYHDGSHSYVDHSGTGDLRIKSSAALALLSSTNEDMILAIPNDSVSLYFNNSKKLETTSAGVTVTGSGIIENTSATTNDSVNVLDLKSLSSGTTANGFGVGVGFFAENSTYSTVNEIGRIEVVETAEANLNDKMIFYVKDNNVLAERLNITGSGATFAGDVSLSTANSDTILTLANTASGGSTWKIQSASSNSASAVASGDFLIRNGSTNVLRLDTSSRATFSGRIRQHGSDTQTGITVSSDLGIELKNTSNTDGNFIPIDFFNSTGFVTARIGAEFVDAGDRDTDIYFCTRSNGGSLQERMRIADDGIVSLQKSIVVNDKNNSIATGNSGTFVTNDANDYPRITTQNANAQIGLFRSGNAAGGMYIGANANGFFFMNDAFSTKVEISQSGSITCDGDVIVTDAGQSSKFETSGNDLVLTANSGQTNVSSNIIFKSSQSGGALNEKMRIDSNGVLQLTTSSSSGFVNANGTALELDVNRNSETGVFGDTNKSHARISLIGNNGGSTIQFNTAAANNTVATTRMTINKDGHLLFNLTDYSSEPTNENFFIADSASGASVTIGGHSGTHTAVLFRHNGATTPGSISITTNSTAYNTSSDYRLKEDLQDFNGLEKVSDIKVYDFKWKVDESRSYGVMAHELEEVLPQAVNGEKDAEEMQSVDYSKIVPLLVKSVQELKAEVDLLKKQCNCK